MALVLFAVFLPFIFYDLYFGINDRVCTTTYISNGKISVTLGGWLLTSGFIYLVLVLLLILASVLICRCELYRVEFSIAYTLIIGIIGLFTLCWLIIGAIMFWGYLYPRKFC